MSAAPLIGENDWPTEAARRVRALYPNQGAQHAAWPMARSHRHAIQYLEQAPALVAFVSWGTQPKTGADRALLSQRFGSATFREPRLKVLMQAFGAPLPIRKICGAAVIPSNYRTILALRHVPNSTLSQAIPETPGGQLIWLRALRQFADDYINRYASRDLRTEWEWAVKALGAAIAEGVPRVHIHVTEIIDLLAAQPARFNPAWTFRSALAAADQWHRELAVRQSEADFLRSNGVAFDYEADYAPLREAASACGYDFVALRSGAALFEEGRAMRHCVSTYTRRVMLGDSRIYSVRQDGLRVATLELYPIPGTTPQYGIAQLKSHCNGRPLVGVFRAAAVFLDEENARIAGERTAARAARKPMSYFTGQF